MFWADEQTTPDFTGEELDLRKRFVEEYIFCNNPITAAQRVGFSGQLAAIYGEQFLGEPHVQKLIKEEQLKFNQRVQDNDPVLKARVVSALFEEANSSAQGSVRVAALNKLANILGLDATLNPQDATEHGGRIVINVRPTDPRIEDVDG